MNLEDLRKKFTKGGIAGGSAAFIVATAADVNKSKGELVLYIPDGTDGDKYRVSDGRMNFGKFKGSLLSEVAASGSSRGFLRTMYLSGQVSEQTKKLISLVLCESPAEIARRAEEL